MSKTKKSTKKATYDPRKAYRWDTNQTFVLTGIEFDIIQNALGSFVMGEATNVQNIAKLINASQVVKSKIKEYVEAGLMTEVELE